MAEPGTSSQVRQPTPGINLLAGDTPAEDGAAPQTRPPPSPPPRDTLVLWHNPKREEAELNRAIFNQVVGFTSTVMGLSQWRESFIHANVDPPHTKESMKELNIDCIVNNPKLRRDINFESRLGFRPTELNGRQSFQKLSKQKYKEGLACEFEILRFLSLQLLGPEAELAARLIHLLKRCRIPRLFKAIRGILETIITETDLPILRDQFDDELRWQEIIHGTCDFRKIILWLGRLLKTHCAPVRDQMIDAVVNEVSKGDIKSIASGLVNLLQVLENMKLDIANHQVRHLKAYFINWTFVFEVKYHGNRIKKSRFLPAPSKAWFDRIQFDTSPIFKDPLALRNQNPRLQSFAVAFVRSLLPPHQLHHDKLNLPLCEPLPETFEMDTSRIRSLKSELLEIIQLRICYSVFVDSWSERSQRQIQPAHEVQILSHMRAISSHGGVLASVPNIAAGIVKWIADMTNQSFSVSTDMQAIIDVEQRLRQGLNPLGMRAAVDELLVPLILDVYEVTTENLHVEYYEIFRKLVPQPPPSTKTSQNVHALSMYAMKPKPSRFPPSLSPIFISQLNEIVNRTAHISILHWRVWSQLVYLDDGVEGNKASNASPSCRSLSKSLPFQHHAQTVVV
jgi:T-complex protein 11